MPLTARLSKPTIAQAFYLAQQLSAAQRERLVAQLNATLEAEVEAAAQRVRGRLVAAGPGITEASIDQEVNAVRASNYAAGRH